MSQYKDRYQALIQRIMRSCEQARRTESSIRWMAVTKTRSVVDIRDVYSLGVRHVGENYAQEAFVKMDELQGLDLTWHFIGRIQSNKAQKIAERFDWVHSVDRIKVLDPLNKGAANARKIVNVCVQVNLDRESQKSGATIENLANIVAYVKRCDHLQLRGLMFIPQPREADESKREVFEQANLLFEDWQAREGTMDTLSMGMSSDLHIAVKCGANFLRIGTDLFGPRNV